MGLIYPGIPQPLVEHLLRSVPLRTFVETGTYLGDTAAWASSHFHQVVTIEASEVCWRQAKAAHTGLANVTFIQGDSRTALPGIIRDLQEPALFWLDAHWSGGPTYGERDECPVLEEVRVILDSQPDSFLLIDDARLFLAPPPLPHSADQWPSIAEVVAALKGSQRYTVIIEDVIASVPLHTRAALVSYCQAVAARQEQQRSQAGEPPQFPWMRRVRRYISRGAGSSQRNNKG